MIEPEVLLQGYRLGVFPMAMEDGAIEWFSPDPRGILPLDGFHIPHALRRVLRRGTFEIRIDTSFAKVIRRCAARGETWINGEIIRSYINLHEHGWAHSVEAWAENKLAGGLYGVAIGGAFFGESMFHEKTDASKVALCALVEHLRAQRFVLLDTQWLTPHLKRFGGIQISRRDYIHLLTRAVALTRKF
ncbi:MAG: leucyl/phenylalanyl-tRNA--protein transferase [Chthoniobacterales bacterium]